MHAQNLAPRHSRVANSVQGRRHKPDYWLVTLSAVLLVIGLIIIYAISPGLTVQQNLSSNYYISRQLLAISLGIVAFLVVSRAPLMWWRKAERPLLIASVGAVIVVRLFGEQINGAYRWIQLGGLSFQPAELVKFALIIGLAGFLTDRLKRGELGNSSKTLQPLLGVLGVITVVIAGLESDLGSTMVMVAITVAMMFVVGLPMKRLMTVALAVVIGLVLLVSTSSYRRQRLVTYLHPTSDCQTTGYQACQALITIGSGGMFGLGLGRSVQAYGYLPESANDSIFAIYAEKFGFIGVSVLLGLFMALFSRLKNILERAPNAYTRLIATGILAWLSTQAIINIGAMIGLLPLKGITLPFISYGGTSLVFVTAALGLAFNISRYTSYGPVIELTDEEGTYYGNSTDRRRLRGAYHPTPGGR
ncbi:MAG TPA: putative lipid II flippase FtsW [Candidatus Saccharimonadales bacterium]|nr:putative lipid II flippase FtsW [Candidatus Saccharimonadales bacterium]